MYNCKTVATKKLILTLKSKFEFPTRFEKHLVALNATKFLFCCMSIFYESTKRIQFWYLPKCMSFFHLLVIDKNV